MATDITSFQRRRRELGEQVPVAGDPTVLDREKEADGNDTSTFYHDPTREGTPERPERKRKTRKSTAKNSKQASDDGPDSVPAADLQESTETHTEPPA